jgi:hypothetical protein
MLKRQMYGCANPDFLRKRVVEAQVMATVGTGAGCPPKLGRTRGRRF